MGQIRKWFRVNYRYPIDNHKGMKTIMCVDGLANVNCS